MKTDSLLLEIGSEEIPAGYILPALEALSSNLLQKLDDARIEHGEAKIYGTPRRLAVKVESVASKQQTVKTEVLGPPAKVGYDQNGKPTVAAEKFAEKVGVSTSKLSTKNTDRGEYLYVEKTEKGRAVKNILKAELVAFFSHLDNALVRRDFLLNGQDSIYYDGTLSNIQAIQNAAYAYIWGIQIGVDYHFAPNFSFLTRFNYQFGKEEDDSGNLEPLRHAAPWFGNSQISFKRNKLDLVLYVFYNGKINFENLAPSERKKTSIYAKDENGNPYSPFWYTLNLKFGYQLLDYLKINLGIENITDQRYRPYSSGITAPGLNFISSVKFSF